MKPAPMFPIHVGKLDKRSTKELATRSTRMIQALGVDAVTVSADTELSVWLEPHGECLPDEWVCNADAIRHHLDLTQHIEENLDVRRDELMPRRIRLKAL